MALHTLRAEEGVTQDRTPKAVAPDQAPGMLAALGVHDMDFDPGTEVLEVLATGKPAGAVREESNASLLRAIGLAGIEAVRRGAQKRNEGRMPQ